MSKRLAVTMVSVGLVVLLVLGLFALLPRGYEAYRQSAVSAAQQAMGAVRTAQLIGQATLAGRALSPYSSRAVTDALSRASSAVADLTGQDVPDGQSQRVRDELTPLLVASTTQIADILSALAADDRPRLQVMVRAAATLGNKVNVFVRRYQ